MRYGVLSLWVGAVALAFLVAGPAVTAERNKEREGGAKAGASAAERQFHGVIRHVDAEKRELTLEGRHREGGGKEGAPGASNRGREQEEEAAGAARREREPAAGSESESATAGKAMTHRFHVSRKVTITLDGKSANLEDLKEGMHAVVTAHQRAGGPAGGERREGAGGGAALTPPAGTSGRDEAGAASGARESGAAGTGAAAGRTGGAAGREGAGGREGGAAGAGAGEHWVATRIEAHSAKGATGTSGSGRD